MSDQRPWQAARLGEIADLAFGATPSRNVENFWDRNGRGFPWASIADLRVSPVSRTAEQITKAGVKGSSVQLVRAGTPLMSFKLTIGRVAVAGVDLYTNEAIVAVNGKVGRVDNRWLCHALPRIASAGILDSAVKGNTLNKHKLEQLEVNLPSLPDQRRIAQILDTADDVIRSTERFIGKLEQARHGLRHDLLTRGIGKFGDLRDPAIPGTFVNSELGLIPCDWRIATVTDTAPESPGSLVIGPFGSDLVANDYRSSGVPVVFVRDVQPDDFSWISDVYVSAQKAAELSAHTVRPGDLVITKMGLPPAIASVYPDGLPPGVVTADIIRLRPDKDTVDPAWLSLAINSDSTRHQVAAITGGVTRPKITLRDFRRLLIALPARGEQEAISNRVRAFTAELAAARRERGKLLLLKRGLLDDLLTGRVRVGVPA